MRKLTPTFFMALDSVVEAPETGVQSAVEPL